LGEYGGVFNFVTKSVVFSRLYVLGSGARCLIFWVNSLASLYAGAPRQLTTGRMGCSGLCSLISPFMVSAVGFMFLYFHLVSGGMSVLLLFISIRTWDWKELVGSCVVVWNLLASMKSLILESYCFMGRITMEFPLSARVTTASFSFSLIFMLLTIFVSGCVCWGLFSFISYLYVQLSNFCRLLGLWGGSCVMAVSASKARFWIQSLGLECRLYLGPFSSSVISCSEKFMSVVLIPLGWNLWCGWGHIRPKHVVTIILY